MMENNKDLKDIASLLNNKYSADEIIDIIACYKYQEKLAGSLGNVPLSVYEFLEQFDLKKLYEEYEEETDDKTSFLEYVFEAIDEYNIFYCGS